MHDGLLQTQYNTAALQHDGLLPRLCPFGSQPHQYFLCHGGSEFRSESIEKAGTIRHLPHTPHGSCIGQPVCCCPLGYLFPTCQQLLPRQCLCSLNLPNFHKDVIPASLQHRQVRILASSWLSIRDSRFNCSGLSRLLLHQQNRYVSCQYLASCNLIPSFLEPAAFATFCHLLPAFPFDTSPASRPYLPVTGTSQIHSLSCQECSHYIRS